MRISDLSSDVCSSDLAGHIAINAGIAGGADVILIPELPYSLAGIAAKIESLKTTGRNFALVVVAEAVKMENGAAVRQQQAAGSATYGGIAHYPAPRIAAGGSEQRPVGEEWVRTDG